MKKVIASVVAVGCLAAAGAAFAGYQAGTGVNGSLHDMNGIASANQDKAGRVCVFCHAPHHAIKDDLGATNYPLWNHTLVDPTKYTGYTWATPANATFGVADINVATVITDPLIGPSRLCMSCHDGAIAIDQHGGLDGTMAQAGGTTVANRAKLTNDLSNTHPIGFDYNAAATARNAAAGNGSATAGGAAEIVPSDYGFATGINVVSTVANQPIAGQGVYNEVLRGQPTDTGFKPIKDTLFQGTYMTCATCHEVHNKENAIQDAYTDDATKAPNYFLYAKENKSLICLSCHIK
ncbi:cytochrome C [Geomonas paludis]|uniref:Cytochrome C n=1 Tax=Geomonas paludis TaxID=2740185 RepID=A0A6V8N0D3_9BACT|nr:cytochrome C [Geomonas paludis]UPU37074.1 cytochrome C [Geomonas paludis]GFO64829.1 cytochrome c [Geomonas paludis]